MVDERLALLFERYMSGSITNAERLELSERSLIGENQLQLQELIRETWDGHHWTEDMAETKAGEMLENILRVRRINYFRIFRRIAVAAVLAGVVFGVYLVFFKKPGTGNQGAAIAKVDIAPGGNKATLTLGNGATMILDSEAVGTLAQQGNTKIIKTDSGRLSYTVENNKAAEVEYNTLATPRGGQYELVLPDGTRVWLNAASSITYPTAFTGNQRLIKMTGEAYFEVVHNASMPFFVRTGNQTVQDIGTAFNINAYTDEAATVTTLIQGSVKILARDRVNILLPGQQESVSGNSVRIDDNVDLEKAIAWRRGLFEFNRMRLPEIMRQVSRWYDVDVRFEGAVSEETFGGGISRNLPLSDVLKLLEANNVKFKLENKTLVVSYPVK